MKGLLMKLFALLLLLATPLLSVVDAVQASVTLDAPIPATDAASLISGYAGAQAASDLVILYRLQLAAHRFADAESTIARLAAVYRSSEPRGVPTLIPWRIYARSKAYEAAGAPKALAMKRAFSEVYGALPDTQAADVYPWYPVSANLARLRNEASDLERACAGKPVASCRSAAALIAAQQAVIAWTYLIPDSTGLLKDDLERRYRVDDRILVPTSDGSEIAVLLVRPRSPTSTRLTSLLNFTIYSRDDWSIGDAVKMAAHGYAGVVAYTRGKGRGRSAGPVVPYVHDGEDAATVIDWLSHQPWSDGRVGMFSGSYNGFTQWAAAKHHPAALKAIATNATNAPGIDTPMQGNVFQTFIYPWPFYTTNGKGLDNATYDDRSRWDKLEREWYMSGRPYRDLDKIDGTPNPIFDAWVKHPDYDDYWKQLIPHDIEFADIDIPVFVQTGYYDVGMVGALHYFEQHYRYRSSAEHRLLVGPYHHTAMQTGVLAKVRGYEVDKVALIDLGEVRLEWFDHVFRDKALPALLSDRVNFEVMGANTWRHVASLGDMPAVLRRFHLTGQREGIGFLFEPAMGAKAPPVLRVDFADRRDVDFRLPEGAIETRNSLVFTTHALKAPLEIDGFFQGVFEVVTNKRDFDLSVDFYELRSNGEYLDLASYLGRASYMRDRSHRQLLTPGLRQTIAFQSQTITSRLLAEGSRIVAVVGVPKVPGIQINYGTGRDVSSESMADAGEPLQVSFSTGSYLELGFRGAHDLPADGVDAALGSTSTPRKQH